MNEARKAVLVTGGSVRIGRALCLALADGGFDVAVHYRNSAAEAGALVAELQGSGRRACAVQGELGTQEACERLVGQAWSAMDGLDALVNNASVFHRTPLLDTTEDILMSEIRPNLVGPMMLTREFARRVAGRNEGTNPRGRIVNLLDRRIAGIEKGCAAYLLSKKMLAEFTRIAALELAPAIAVNGVAPGAILAPVGEADGSRAREAAGPVPLDRPCTPQDVAAAVRFLLESDAITGQVIYVDGGQHLR